MPETRQMHLIRDGRLQADDSRRFVPATDAAAQGPALPPDEPGWIVPLATWTAAVPVLRERHHPVAILLGPADDPASLAESGTPRIDPRGIAWIGVDFPHYTDGRGFSIAQLLRTHHGWTGELRATGDVLIDTVHYLARCGFNSFLVKPEHDAAKALQALHSFSVHYQRGYAAPAATAASSADAPKA